MSQIQRKGMPTDRASKHESTHLIVKSASSRSHDTVRAPTGGSTRTGGIDSECLQRMTRLLVYHDIIVSGIGYSQAGYSTRYATFCGCVGDDGRWIDTNARAVCLSSSSQSVPVHVLNFDLDGQRLTLHPDQTVPRTPDDKRARRGKHNDTRI